MEKIRHIPLKQATRWLSQIVKSLIKGAFKNLLFIFVTKTKFKSNIKEKL